MNYITYFIYIILYEGAILFAAYHVVFKLNRSGWWIVLAMIISACAYSPREWAALESKEVQQQLHEEKMEKIRNGD